MSQRRNSKVKGRSSIISQLAIPHYSLTNVEKKFLLNAERGDCASVKKIIDQYLDKPEEFNINCLDPVNRSALIIALEKENIDLINLLLESGIQVKDALLHAIDEDYVEGVEVLLQWEEKTHVAGEPYSWEAVEKSESGYTIDMTPVTLAAQKNNYEILKLLLDRGATLPSTHDIRCGCDECTVSKEQDSLRYSQSRINAYRAMISPSLICLSSRDPLLTAIELYDELKKLEKMETEFRAEYKEMINVVQEFSTSLLDHVRTSSELEIILNYNPDPQAEIWEPGERQSLDRLKLAIKCKLKSFVAHANVQQLLASIWYEGLSGFRRKTMFPQILEVGKIASMFFVYSFLYMLHPHSAKGGFLKKPFVKFVCHSASYATFLGLLAMASQRVERLALGLSGIPYLQEILKEWIRKERGSLFGFVEFMIIFFVISLIWKEMRSLYEDGLEEYLSDLWNILDFCSNVGYVSWIGLRLSALYVVHKELKMGLDPWYPRNQWHKLDPHMLSECAFASGMILSFMKLVNIFSVNPHLGPLQISLGRMIIDIIKFFFIYTLVLFAFGCGLNQLLWYFAGLEEEKCYHLDGITPDFEQADKACTIWRRFANIFETSQSLFWASFGLVDLTAFDLRGIKSFTRFWSLLIFGCYSVINIIVLLNMLIAMMSNSYQIISERSDVEWKYARSKLFISYFEDGDTLPPPFNLFPSTKNITKWLHLSKTKKTGSIMKKKETSRERADLRYDVIMQLLVRRYITCEQKKLEEFAVTEDDITEVRHDISTLRYELIEIFRRNNYNLPANIKTEDVAQGKRDRLMERRIIKDFQIGMVEGIVSDIISSEQKPTNIFSKIAKAIGKGESTKKKDWNEMVRKNTLSHDPIGSTSEATRKVRQQSVRRYILECQDKSLLNLDTDKLVEYNPSLAAINPTARIAYAKFKMRLIKQEYDGYKGMTEGPLFTAQKSNIADEILRTTSIKRRSSFIDGRRLSETRLEICDESKERRGSKEKSDARAEEALATIIEIPTDETKDVTAKSTTEKPEEHSTPTEKEDEHLITTKKDEKQSATTTKEEKVSTTSVVTERPGITPKKVVGGKWL